MNIAFTYKGLIAAAITAYALSAANTVAADAFGAVVPHHPWNRFFVHSFCGTEHVWMVSDSEKIMPPGDLMRFLQSVKVNGLPLIDGDGVERSYCLLH